MPKPFIHPSAIIEDGVQIGDESKIWDHVHIRKGALIGHHTQVGEKSYVAYDVKIGNFVKINAMVYIPAFVTIEDGCMISAGTVFTNDLYPRSMNREGTGLETSDPTEETLHTVVKKGVTIGANATIGPGITLGDYAMIGMGAVVTKNVPPFGLVIGNPARLVGYVCACGPRLFTLDDLPEKGAMVVCNRCERAYFWNGEELNLLEKEKTHAST
jgi:acetyltransferase-like isoleucine patch superfamily enzyme